MPRTISPQRLFRDALGVPARGGTDRTITSTEAERALRALGAGVAPDVQRAIVSAFLGSRAASQLSARAEEALRGFVARAGAPAAGDSVLDVRSEAVRETRSARARTATAQARLDQLLAGGGAQSAAQLKSARAALAAARVDVADARALVLRIGTARGVRAAARSLALAAADLETATALLEDILGRARGARVKRSDVDAVKRWLLAPGEELAEAEMQLSRARSSRSGGGYTTAKAPSDSEDQGATPPPPPGGSSGTTPRSAIDRLRRSLSTLDDDEDDP